MLLRRADVARVLERDPRVAGLEQHGQHPPPQVDRAWFAELTRGAWRQVAELDPLIEARLAPGWTLARAGYLLRALLRAGAYELAAQPDVPAKVVINEYVELGHAFLSDQEAGFVNALLDRLAAELRPGTAT